MCSIIDSTRTEAHLAETCPLAGHHRPQHRIASGAVVTAAVAVCDLELERLFQGFGLRNMTQQHRWCVHSGHAGSQMQRAAYSRA